MRNREIFKHSADSPPTRRRLSFRHPLTSAIATASRRPTGTMFKRGAAAAPALAFEPGPMGPLVDTLVSRALEAVFGAGERVALEIFFHHALLALTLCLGIFIASKVVSPVLFGKTLAKLAEPFERKIWHTNMVTFFHLRRHVLRRARNHGVHRCAIQLRAPRHP